MTPFLCSSCRTQFYPIESPKCIRCGEMFKSRTGSDHICEKCLTQKTHFDCIRSAGQYDGSLMALIHRFKYKRKMQLARPLGRLLFHAFVSYSELPVPDVIVPVPLHPSQIKKRGFNQASLILNQWAAFFPESGCPCPDIAYDGKILKRIKNTHSQTSLSREQRRLNIREAFSLNPDSRVQGKTVLIIDDVCTTGSTVNECAAILKNGGADCVNVLTLARAA